MKVAICLAAALLAAACSKKPQSTDTTGSGSTVAPKPDEGSAKQPGSAAAATTGSGSATAGSGAAAPATAQAIDDFDRVLAPIWKLDVAARVDALCTHAGPLSKAIVAIDSAPPPPGESADDWHEDVHGLSVALNEIGQCCTERPQDPKARAKAPDDTSCFDKLHDRFVELAKKVPGAAAPDSHANEPVK